ncbi:MAG: MATE family efflux transporter, partial [Rhizobiales bacterium]|nr:MATE family efflux transporter [Hyphomicrobiales bacterium]
SRLFGQALLLAVITGGLVALYGLLAADALFRLAGMEGVSLELARRYLVPILVFSFIFLVNAACNGMLTAQGDARSFRNALIAGALLNIVLNPLFMFGLGPIPALGVLGIAVSTILIQFLECLYLWRRCRQSELGRHFRLASLKPDPEAMLWLLRQAVPVTGQMLTTGIGLFAITYFMGRHGEVAVAAYGIALRIEQLAMLPMVGLSTAALTLVGQNHGAKKPARVSAVAWMALGYGIALMVLGASLVWPLRHALMGLFTDDAQVVGLGAAYLNVAVLNFCAYALLMIGSSILQGMRRPLFALIIGLFRHVFGPMVVLWLLDPVLGFGLAGIYWGIFGVAWIGALTTLLYLRYRLGAAKSVDLPETATAVRAMQGRHR